MCVISRMRLYVYLSSLLVIWAELSSEIGTTWAELSWADFFMGRVVLGRLVFGPSCPELFGPTDNHLDQSKSNGPSDLVQGIY